MLFKSIQEKLKTLRNERSQPSDGSSIPQLIDENRLFYDAVGGRNKRNRIYGIGSSHDTFYEPSSNVISYFSSSQPNIQDYQKLQTEFQEMKERIKEIDEMKQRMREMESQLARMFDSQN